MAGLVMIKSCLTLVVVVAVLLLASWPAAIDGAGLKIGFYNKTCPNAEALVQQALAEVLAKNPGAAPTLIRMFFHDCFVRGCDGSVLLDSTPGNRAEKEAFPNNPSLRGFDVIDTIKSKVEAACPKTVSCADIVAFAARDSVAFTGNFTYKIPSGRRDGLVSLEAEANANLPAPSSNASQLIASFATKNLTADELVTLSGIHSIGIAHCSSFLGRIYNFSNTSQTDPSMSLGYATLLRNTCPQNSTSQTNISVFNDVLTPLVLDNKYYLDLENNLGLFTSDQTLTSTANLSAAVKNNAKHPNRWKTKFARAMVKMGEIQVLTGTQGEIRLKCSVINSKSLMYGSGGDGDGDEMEGVASS